MKKTFLVALIVAGALGGCGDNEDVMDAAPDVEMDVAPDVTEDVAPDVPDEPDAEPDVMDAEPDVMDAEPDVMDAEPDVMEPPPTSGCTSDAIPPITPICTPPAAPAHDPAGEPFAGGTGTEADPFMIATIPQLNRVRDHLDSHFILVADIDIRDVSEFFILGIEGTFSGSLDGRGHSVILITLPYLFEHVSGSIRNLRIRGNPDDGLPGLMAPIAARLEGTPEAPAEVSGLSLYTWTDNHTELEGGVANIARYAHIHDSFIYSNSNLSNDDPFDPEPQGNGVIAAQAEHVRVERVIVSGGPTTQSRALGAIGRGSDVTMRKVAAHLNVQGPRRIGGFFGETFGEASCIDTAYQSDGPTLGNLEIGGAVGFVDAPLTLHDVYVDTFLVDNGETLMGGATFGHIAGSGGEMASGENLYVEEQRQEGFMLNDSVEGTTILADGEILEMGPALFSEPSLWVSGAFHLELAFEADIACLDPVP